MSLGDELRKAREAAELTQEKVSVAAGIDRAYLSQLENDHKSPTVDVLFRVCRALGTPASEILARVERSPRAKPPTKSQSG
jgi:transcriptional regulator with XRE-family HTH domain